MLAKYVIIVLFFTSVVLLFSALRHLVKETEHDKEKLFKKLGLRVILCFVTFSLLLFAWAKGWVNPHPL